MILTLEPVNTPVAQDTVVSQEEITPVDPNPEVRRRKNDSREPQLAPA